MMTSMIEDGIRIPSVPAEAIVPTASSLLKPRSIIAGKAMSVSITTEAPTMPVVAAMMVPISVTDIASPTGTRRMSTCRQCSKSLATPLRSSTVPMKMNIGTATRIGLDAAEPKMRGSRLKNCTGMKTSSSMPMKPNTMAMPPSTKATG